MPIVDPPAGLTCYSSPFQENAITAFCDPVGGATNYLWKVNGTLVKTTQATSVLIESPQGSSVTITVAADASADSGGVSVTPIAPDRDGNGFTIITTSVDTNIVHVSSSTGNDSTGNGSSGTPYATLAKAVAVARSGFPDHIALLCGDTWNENFGTIAIAGRGPLEPFVFESYGTGVRPIINTDLADGILINGFGDGGIVYNGDYVVIRGINFVASGRDPALDVTTTTTPAGVNFTYSRTCLVEDCSFIWFDDNILMGACADISVRRCVAQFAYDNVGHAEGAFAAGIIGINVEDTFAYHNGWISDTSEQNVFDHNFYFSSSNDLVHFQNTISARASSHGYQARVGGVVHNCLFIENAIGMSYGYDNGSPAYSGGVIGSVTDCVYDGNVGINGDPRGWAIEIGNCASALFANLIVINDTQQAYPAFIFDYGSVDNPDEAVGINNATIQNCIVYGQKGGIRVTANADPGGTGQYAFNNVQILNNDFQNITGAAVDIPSIGVLAQMTFRGNRYYSSTLTQDQIFNINGVLQTFAWWVSNVESNAQWTQVAYLDTSRDTASYNASLGGANTVDDFITNVMGNTSSSWNNNLTASGAFSWISNGFSSSFNPNFNTPITNTNGSIITYPIIGGTSPYNIHGILSDISLSGVGNNTLPTNTSISDNNLIINIGSAPILKTDSPLISISSGFIEDASGMFSFAINNDHIINNSTILGIKNVSVFIGIPSNGIDLTSGNISNIIVNILG